MKISNHDRKVKGLIEIADLVRYIISALLSCPPHPEYISQRVRKHKVVHFTINGYG